MKCGWLFKTIEILLLILIITVTVGQSVLHLWNWLMPGIFGLRIITFWEAVGLAALSWLLFGGFRGSGRMWGGHWKYTYDRPRLTPEQRARLRHGLGDPASPQA